MPSLSHENNFLKNMRSGHLEHLYVCGNHATPRHVDFVAGTGLFTSIWFDLEHFDIPTQQLAVLTMVLRSYPMTTFARFKANDYQSVMRVLETGVGGIICSMVSSKAEAEHIVRWAKFNNPTPGPDEAIGLRGWNGGGIDARYGTLPVAEYVRQQNNEVALLCQIETQDALDLVDEIASVPGVNGLFFGPGDFAHNIGNLGQIGHPKVFEAMAKVGDACKRHGKFWGTLGIGRENYVKVKELGAGFICPGGDVRVLINGIRELAKVYMPE